MEAIDWSAVWGDVAAEITRHRQAGRGHLLTEDTLRLATVLALGRRDVAPHRIAVEVPVAALAGGKLDLVVDPPGGTVIELKYPRDSRTGISPDTMTFGELLRDFLRVAVVPASDRWVVQLLNPRLVRYLDAVCHRHGLHWPTATDDVLTLRPETLSTLPSTATRAIGPIAGSTTVSATCTLAAPVDDGLMLYAHSVVAGVPATPGHRSPAAVPDPASLERPPGMPSTPSRDGARSEILGAARAIVARTGRDEFTVPDVVAEMHARGTGYADTTIRTMMTSHLCAEATGDGVAGYTDLTRVGRALYRLTR